MKDDLATAFEELVLLVMSPHRHPKALSADRLSDVFEFEDEQFSRVSSEDFFGFYDWLRSETATIIGIQVHLDESTQLDHEIENMRGVSIMSPPDWNGAKRAIILFGANDKFDEQLSGDQEFGGNNVYQGSRGSVALTFVAPSKNEVVLTGSAP